MSKTRQQITNPMDKYRWLLMVLLGVNSVFYGSIGMTAGQSVEQVTLDYQLNGNTVVTDGLNKQKTYEFEILHDSIKPQKITETYTDRGQTVSAETVYTYTANGQVKTLTDAKERITEYDYNDRGLLIQRIEAKGEPEQRLTTYDWHSQHRVPTRITVGGRITEYEYDSCSTGTGFHVCQMTLTDQNNPAESRSWTYTYTTAADNTITGLIKSIDGPHTDKPDLITYSYYDLNHAFKGRVNTISNGLNQVTTITAYDGNGRATTLVDANQNTYTFTYDPRGRLRSRTIGLGTTASTTSYDYTAYGALEKITQGSGDYLKYGYDGAHRLTSIEDNLGNKILYTLDAMSHQIQQEWMDPEGNVRQISQRERNEMGWITLLTDGENHHQRYAYDLMGNQIAVTDPRITVGSDIAAIRNLNPMTLDNSTLREYDTLDRLKENTHIRRNSETDDDVSSQYQYNVLDQLTTVMDPKNLSTLYQVNALGDIKQITSPDTGVTDIQYDTAGNPKTQIDARDKDRDQSVAYQYDALNRLKLIDYQDDSLDVQLHYDEPASSNGVGQLTRMQDASGTSTYHYDSRGNRIQITTLRDGLSHTTHYQYNESDQIIQITYPSGRQVGYQRDSNGQVSAITETYQTVVNPLATAITYLPFGPIKSFHYGNGISTTREYGLDYRIKTLNSSPALSLTFSYDAAGNITQINDLLNRLVDEQVLIHTDNNYQLGTQSHHLLEITGSDNQVFSYDKNGNTIAKGNHSYVYGDHNRLLEAKRHGLIVGRYTYNGQGERVKKEVDGVATYFHYNQAGQLIAESEASGQVVKEYTYLKGQLLAIWQAENGTTNTYYIHNDHLGTPKTITDTAQAIVWEGHALPFGTVVNSNGTIINNVRFPGQYFDNETGLHYNYQRYYDPFTGRYITSDPIGLQGGLNTYGYAYQNPLIYTDPTGEFGLFGAGVGFAFEVGIQMYKYGWNNPECWDWADIAISTAVGAIAPGAFGTAKNVVHGASKGITQARRAAKAKTTGAANKHRDRRNKWTRRVADEIATQGAWQGAKQAAKKAADWQPGEYPSGDGSNCDNKCGDR